MNLKNLLRLKQGSKKVEHFIQKDFPKKIIQFESSEGDSEKQTKGQVYLPGCHEDDEELSSSSTSVVLFNPFKKVQACVHKVKYFKGTKFDIYLVNSTEIDAVSTFIRYPTVDTSKQTLKVFVGGEDTHDGIGDLRDFVTKLNFWKKFARENRGPLIVQTSANYYAIGNGTFINASVVADCTRGTAHVLIKSTVATNIDRFGSEPEKMFTNSSPRLTSTGGFALGNCICLDSALLSKMFKGKGGSFNVAIVSAFADPSSMYEFPLNTVRIVCDHRATSEETQHNGRYKGGSVVVDGALTIPPSFFDVLFGSGPRYNKDVDFSQIIQSEQSKEETVVSVDREGNAKITVGRNSNSPPSLSQLAITDPVPLEMVVTTPPPSPNLLQRMWSYFFE